MSGIAMFGIYCVMLAVFYAFAAFVYRDKSRDKEGDK